MKSRKAHEEYDQTVERLTAMHREGRPYVVDCPICRHKFGFINEQQAQLKKADMRRALISFVGRAIHKFLD